MYRLLVVCMSLLAACTSEHLADIDQAEEGRGRDPGCVQTNGTCRRLHAAGEGQEARRYWRTTRLRSFIYQGPEARVRITGGMTQWAGEIELENIAGTDVHYYRGVYPVEARLEYLMLLDDRASGPRSVVPP